LGRVTVLYCTGSHWNRGAGPGPVVPAAEPIDTVHSATRMRVRRGAGAAGSGCAESAAVGPRGDAAEGSRPPDARVQYYGCDAARTAPLPAVALAFTRSATRSW